MRRMDRARIGTEVDLRFCRAVSCAGGQTMASSIATSVLLVAVTGSTDGSQDHHHRMPGKKTPGGMTPALRHAELADESRVYAIPCRSLYTWARTARLASRRYTCRRSPWSSRGAGPSPPRSARASSSPAPATDAKPTRATDELGHWIDEAQQLTRICAASARTARGVVRGTAVVSDADLATNRREAEPLAGNLPLCQGEWRSRDLMARAVRSPEW